MKELVKFFVVVKLLIQQYAAPSATREEIDQNQLAFFFRLGNGIIQAALEPVLSEAEGGKENEEKRQYDNFSHSYLLFECGKFITNPTIKIKFIIVK